MVDTLRAPSPVVPPAVVGVDVLLVEDDADNREICTVILEHAGYRVVQAWSGEEGVRLARGLLPAMVLMDLSLPGLSGWDATRLLKEDEATRGIPVLALTAHGMPAQRALAAEAGCAGYLVKPVAPRDIVARVRETIGAPSRAG